jgi:DNA-binding CsgD family transcriptional regulator
MTSSPKLSQSDHSAPRLTRREKDVLLEVVQGYHSKTIAYRLGISERVVRFYRSQIRKKLRARTSAYVVYIAITQCLVCVPFNRSVRP